MSNPSIDATGFHGIGLQGYLDDLTALWQSLYGTDIDLTTNGPDAQLINGLAARFANLEQLAQQVYNGRSPAGAVGAGLSRLVQLNGITRKPAGNSSAPVTLTGVPGTVIPEGSLIGSASDTSKAPFQTTAELTIGVGGTVDGTASCTVTGPVQATAGDLTQILSRITGWTEVTNTSAASPGTSVEADPLLRIRRASSVALPSQSMLDGLQAALQALQVIDARVYENTSGVTDDKGLPGHSINAIVQNSSASNADIANVLWLKSGMGATQVGAQSAGVVDDNGDTQTMHWDWATTIDAYVVVKVLPAQTSAQLLFLSQQLGNAIQAYFSTTGTMPTQIGQNVAWFDLATPINALGLTGRPGLPNVTAVFLGSSPSPTTQADLVVPYNAIALFDASRVSVVNG